MQEIKTSQTLDYLTFVPGVRLHWSEVRQQYWLLFPEAALALNSTAAAILSKCDGNHSKDEILKALKQQYQDVKVSDVENLLLSVFKRGLLIRSKVKG